MDSVTKKHGNITSLMKSEDFSEMSDEDLSEEKQSRCSFSEERDEQMQSSEEERCDEDVFDEEKQGSGYREEVEVVEHKKCNEDTKFGEQNWSSRSVWDTELVLSYAEKMSKVKEKMFQKVKKNIDEAQKKDKHYYDKKHSNPMVCFAKSIILYLYLNYYSTIIII